MGTSFSLKLSFCLFKIPSLDVEVSDVQIQGFCDDWTCGNSPVGAIRRYILPMTLKDDASIDSIDLIDGGVVDILEESIEQEMEVFPTSRSGIVVMIRCNAVYIIYICFKFLQ